MNVVLSTLCVFIKRTTSLCESVYLCRVCFGGTLTIPLNNVAWGRIRECSNDLMENSRTKRNDTLIPKIVSQYWYKSKNWKKYFSNKRVDIELRTAKYGCSTGCRKPLSRYNLHGGPKRHVECEVSRVTWNK